MAEQNWYIHLDLNKNELRDAIIGSSSYPVKPLPNLDDKGLVYYDHILNHIMVWDGYRWRFSQYLDDRDYVSTDTILLDNVWTQTNLIVNNPGNTTSAASSSVVDWISITLSHVTYSYTYKDYSGVLKDLVPSKYGNIYKPYIKDILNNNIPDNFNNWKLEGDSITFYGGLTNSPTASITEGVDINVSFLKYTGDKGIFNFINQSIYEITNPSYPYDVLPFPFPYTVTPSVNNTTITVNGLSVYDWSFFPNNITLATMSLGYGIDNNDKIWVQYFNL